MGRENEVFRSRKLDETSGESCVMRLEMHRDRAVVFAREHFVLFQFYSAAANFFETKTETSAKTKTKTKKSGSFLEKRGKITRQQARTKFCPETTLPIVQLTKIKGNIR